MSTVSGRGTMTMVFAIIGGLALTCGMLAPPVGGAYLVNLDRLMERGSSPNGIISGSGGGGGGLGHLPSHLQPVSSNVKREVDTERCHPTRPFRCPGKGTVCISIQYLCDGAPDCPDGYDEHAALCTAAKRPPVEETASFMQSLLARHGPNYLEKLFGPKARGALAPLGGVQRVAVALSESETLEDFGKALHLMRGDLEHLRNVFMAVETGDTSLLRALGFRDSELMDMKSFLDRLASTGFME